MSNKSYLGTNHKFTSSGKDSYIELSSGTGENLRIKTIFNEYIKSNIDSDILGDNQLSGEQVLQHSSAAARSQGTSISITDTGSKHYILAGCPNFPNSGGCAVFDNTGTGTFSQYATVLVNTSLTTEGYYGEYSDINEDATISAFTDLGNYARTINIYKRSGSTWTIYGTLAGAQVAVSGLYLLTYNPSNGTFKVYLDNLTGYVAQQTLLTDANTSPKVDITTGDTVALTNDNDIYIYQRTSTTWTNTQIIGTGLAVVSLKFSGNLLQYSNSVGIYTYERSAQGSSYILKISKTFSGIVDFCCTTTGGALANTYLFLGTSAIIYVFKRVADAWVQSFNTTATTGLYKLNCTGKYLSIGRPAILDKGVVSVYKISDYENGELIPANNILDMHGVGVDLTSVYGSVNINDGISVGISEIILSKPITGLYTRNMLINGGFQIFQRSWSSFQKAIAASTTDYTFDRWQLRTTANQASVVSRQIGNYAYDYCARVQRNDGQTGTGLHLFCQSLTRDMTLPSLLKKVSISFYARKSSGFSAVNNELVVWLLAGTGTTDVSGINGIFSGASTVLVDSVNLTTSFTKYTFTTTSALAEGITQLALQVGYAPVGTASTDYYEIANVVLSPTDFPIDFDYVPVAEEISKCEYFYQTFGYMSGHAANTATIQTGIFPKVKMRAAPTVGSVTGTGTTAAVLTVTDGAAGFTEASFSFDSFIPNNEAGASGGLFGLNNFTGMTGFRPYVIHLVAPYNLLTASAELV